MARRRASDPIEPNEVSYVGHPRWGSRPRRTGLDVRSRSDVYLHWQNLCDGARPVPDTAVPADLERQTPATLAVTHYYDVERPCRDCGRRFLFFAIEQKHWYEELGFPLEAVCVRCFPCRRQVRELKAQHARYQQLLELEAPPPEQEEELALLRMELMEAQIFAPTQADAARAFLRRHADHSRVGEIGERLARLERRDPGR